MVLLLVISKLTFRRSSPQDFYVEKGSSHGSGFGKKQHNNVMSEL